jgi:Phage portal protein, SPP1 Gp6-like.
MLCYNVGGKSADDRGNMKTYQDLMAAGDVMEFTRSAITEHKSSSAYKTASDATEYAAQRNVTITRYQKLLYDMSGKAVPDNWSANYKLCSNFFDRFTTQQTQYLLGNGPEWGEESTAGKLGDDFPQRLREAGKYSLIQGVSFGFMNLDHLDVFKLTEFVPLYDEENGALMAGIRFWQISNDKPLRATLYEIDGYTDYIWRNGEGEAIDEKKTYKMRVTSNEVDGGYIFEGENYPTFPIVPLWGNQYHQSELVGLRSEIDAYDLIKSGFANDLDDASQIYWALENAGGMDDIDMAKFIERMKTVHAAQLDGEGARATAHTIEVPYNAREVMLDRLRADMYEDYMALDTKNMASGAVTATQIRAAYEPVNAKADEWESLVKDFVGGILSVLGIDDKPTFTRSAIVNETEEVQTIVNSASYLSSEYVTRKILSVFGDLAKADEVIAEMEKGESTRFGFGETGEETPPEAAETPLEV